MDQALTIRPPSALSLPDKPHKPKRRQTEREFVPSLSIKRDDQSVVHVPRDADANRNASIILAEIARIFVTEQAQKINDSGRILTPSEIKEMVTAMKLANETAIVAHENLFIPSDLPKTKASKSDTGNILAGMEAVAKGLAKGNAEANREAVEKFLAAGKRPMKNADVIDIPDQPKT